MTPCAMSFERLNEYVDGALAAADELDIRRHLDVCLTCRASVETLLTLKEAVAASVEVRPVPHTLRERLGTLLVPRQRARRRRLRRLGALAAGVLLAVGAARFALAPRHAAGDRISEALVADHLHFLQVPDAVEVASDDPERVAAWFGDKLAFPVRLPRLESASLLGGRLCSFWGHKVALAFYEARGRRLSLFVADDATFPSAGGCRTGLGDYRVCLVPAAGTMLAMVADNEQTAAVLPELQGAVRGQ